MNTLFLTYVANYISHFIYPLMTKDMVSISPIYPVLIVGLFAPQGVVMALKCTDPITSVLLYSQRERLRR